MRWLRLGLAGFFVAAAVGCDQDVAEVDVSFVNDTQRPIGYLLDTGGGIRGVTNERRTPALIASGGVIETKARLPRPTPPPGEPWCPADHTYYFLSPKEGVPLTADTPFDDRPVFDLDDFDVVDVIESPCWPAQYGNSYRVTGAGS